MAIDRISSNVAACGSTLKPSFPWVTLSAKKPVGRKQSGWNPPGSAMGIRDLFMLDAETKRPSGARQFGTEGLSVGSTMLSPPSRLNTAPSFPWAHAHG